MLSDREPPAVRPSYTGDWHNGANCLTTDPELFFPDGKTRTPRQIEDAKKVCNGCEVRDQCLQYALETEQEFGIWGGLTEDERRAFKRRVYRSRMAGGAALERL